jgi:hypothetical protein
MSRMIIRHKVRDYSQWRPIFDGQAKIREAAGLSHPRVYHSAEGDKNDIMVVFTIKDREMAKTFAHSLDFSEAMEKAGVMNIPTFYFIDFDHVTTLDRAGTHSENQFISAPGT